MKENCTPKRILYYGPQGEGMFGNR